MKTMRRIFADKLNRSAAVRQFLLWMFFVMFLSLIAVSLFAQSNKLETEKGLTEAIAPYDAGVRNNILVASEYPTVLTQLKNAQAQTAESFQKIIGKFRQKKQEWFYTITRYPELMHQLATLPGKQTQEQIYKLLPHQDPDLKEAAWRLYKSEKKNLAKLDNVRIKANGDFENSISHLNARAREAFHQLQTKPDVLILLTNNIELTSKLGEHFRNNPGEITNQLSALHDKIENQNERDAAAFKKQMEEDPKAMKELRQASNAYNTNSYYGPYYYPYSYWFGYPYWYSYPMWYPGMFWYYPGFYFGAGGLWGFPSYGFTFWFYNGGYYTRYPHLYQQFGVYYRTNISVSRTNIVTANRGFMNVAAVHYEPRSVNARLTSTSPFAYRQTSNFTRVNRTAGNSFNRGSMNNYRVQNFGNMSGRGSFGGGSIGGGLHGGFHGGRH